VSFHHPFTMSGRPTPKVTSKNKAPALRGAATPLASDKHTSSRLLSRLDALVSSGLLRVLTVITKCNDISTNFHFCVSRQNEQSESGNWLHLAAKRCHLLQRTSQLPYDCPIPWSTAESVLTGRPVLSISGTMVGM